MLLLTLVQVTRRIKNDECSKSHSDLFDTEKQTEGGISKLPRFLANLVSIFWQDNSYKSRKEQALTISFVIFLETEAAEARWDFARHCGPKTATRSIWSQRPRWVWRHRRPAQCCS